MPLAEQGSCDLLQRRTYVLTPDLRLKILVPHLISSPHSIVTSNSTELEASPENTQDPTILPASCLFLDDIITEAGSFCSLCTDTSHSQGTNHLSAGGLGFQTLMSRASKLILLALSLENQRLKVSSFQEQRFIAQGLECQHTAARAVAPELWVLGPFGPLILGSSLEPSQDLGPQSL